jgi:hypothetical protein
MVELWLPYGRLEVMADIRDEQVVRVVAPPPGEGSEGMLADARRLALLEEGPGALRLLRSAPPGAKVYLRRGLQAARRACEERGLEVAELRYERRSFQGLSYALPQLEEGSVIINSMRPDPLFGVSCLAARLLRLEGGVPEALLEELPGRAARGEELVRALAEEIKGFEVVELVEGASGVQGAFRGNPPEVLAKARELLERSNVVRLEARARAIVASSGGHPWDRDMCEGLVALWNLRDAVEQGASIILLCEAAEGLGSRAWEAVLLAGMRPRGYYRGAEHSLLLRDISSRASITLVSALPEALVRRLGLSPAPSLSAALRRLGPRARMHIVPNAGCTVLRAS